MFWQRKGKNKKLNERIQVTRADMENNYKDAAQSDFRRVKEIFTELCQSGQLPAKEQDYYTGVIRELEGELAHFTHREGPGTGKFGSDRKEE